MRPLYIFSAIRPSYNIPMRQYSCTYVICIAIRPPCVYSAIRPSYVLLYVHHMYPFQSSGLSAWIGQQLLVFESLPNWLIVVLVAALVAGLTEFTSNTATSSLLLPVIAQLVRTNSMLLSIVWQFTRVPAVQGVRFPSGQTNL